MDLAVAHVKVEVWATIIGMKTLQISPMIHKVYVLRQNMFLE